MGLLRDLKRKILGFGRGDRQKARRLEKLLERYPDAEQIPYRELVEAVGPEVAARANPHLDMTEKELVEKLKAYPEFKDLTDSERDQVLDLLRPMLKKR